MKLAIVLGLALVLAVSAQAPCKLPSLDGYWWRQAEACDRALYLKAFADGGGRVSADEPEAAIERWYARTEDREVPLKQAIRAIWGSADKAPAESLR